MDEPSSKPAVPRYESLDVWRGVACLAVVVVHSATFLARHPAGPDAGWIDRVTRAVLGFGWAGVPMFFVISGYCIAAAADAARRRGDGPGAFFVRRFRRIFPPYWCWLAISVATVIVAEHLVPGLYVHPHRPGNHPATIAPIHWLGNLTLTEVWLGHLTGQPFEWRNMILGQSWTLCYEEQFYAVVGVLAWWAGARLGAVLAAVTTVILVRWLAFPLNINSGFFFDGRWLFFAAGLAVWFDIARRDLATRLLTRGFLLVGLVWSLHDPSLFLARSHGVEHEWLVSFVFAWTILLLHPFDRRIAASRLLQPLAACGTMCYSIYLVHWTVLRPITVGLEWAGCHSVLFTVLVTVPVSVAASIAVGVVFHRAVERRFLAAGPSMPPGVVKIPAPVALRRAS